MKHVYNGGGGTFITLLEAWLTQDVKYINHVTHVNYVKRDLAYEA